MEILLAIGVPVLLMFGIPVVLSVAGVLIENRHERILAEREAAVAGFPVISTTAELDGAQVELLSSSVVMGIGYLKNLFIGLRSVFGGEIASVTRVMDRGRRETYVRIVEEAERRGGTALVNVRFETSDVGGQQPAAEILCYATMIRQHGESNTLGHADTARRPR